MPQGLKNAGACFTRLMMKVLGKMQFEEALIYLDDCLLFSTNFIDHMATLDKVLSKFAEAGLTIKPEKCFICKERVDYTGYSISKEGITITDKATEAIETWPVPCDIKELQKFLGFASFFREFIPDFSLIDRTLRDLLKKDIPFLWTEKHESSFNKLKCLLSSKPVLAFPNWSKPFILVIVLAFLN